MSAGGGEQVEEEEEEEVLLLDSPSFSKQLTEDVRAFEGSEKQLLEWLVEEKPPDLKMGREHYLDSKELEEYMKGLCLKLSIHGYEDRARRLKYLYEVLAVKFANKESVFKIVVQFLMDMAQRPTAVTHLPLSSVEYSLDPDEEETSSSNDNSERQKALLKEILGGGDEDAPTTSYSSGDSLSDWSEDDSEDVSTKSNNDLPPGITRPVRTSSSFGEFSDIFPPQEKKPDPEKIRKETELFWRGEKQKAEEHLLLQIRQFKTFPLQSQPVISSRLVLQARFGEFWEWKQQHRTTSESIHQTSPKTASSSSGLQVAFVEDIVREVLWQFVISRADSSAVFNPDWSVKSNLMVASLSRSTFSRVLTKFGAALCKLEALRKFEKSVLSACHNFTSTNLPPSKVHRNYASGLQDISIFIIEHVNKIERELKRLPRAEKDPQGPACTTFVQLMEQTRDIIEIIDTVYKVHSKSIPSENEDGEEGEEEEEEATVIMPWLSSIKLISSIESHLVMETRPRLHGVLLFLYSKCLQALLDELLLTLKSLQWDERYSLFIRDKTLLLNDESFWSDCIKIREFPSFTTSTSTNYFVSNLGSIRKLLPKVLNILKTCEVFDQLQEDFTQILMGASEISVESLVQEFLEESLSPRASELNNLEEQNQPNPSKTDFHKHFEALGLGSSLASDCFRFLTDATFVQATTPKERHFPPNRRSHYYTLQDFLHLSAIPTKCHSLLLDTVLSKWFDPFCMSAKRRIGKIFQDYKVLERMTIFQEIILAVREDFARGIILIASKDYHNQNKMQLASSSSSSEYKFEDTLARNSKFQRLLNGCYPLDCRGELFSIDLKLDWETDMNCTFDVKPHFPLNLIVTPQSVAGYLFIGRQLHRIRKSLWHANSLSMKTCCCEYNAGGSRSVTTSGGGGGGGVDKNRLLIFRFCLINFCSSLRSFFMLKVFSRDFVEYSSSATTTAACSASQSATNVDSFETSDLDYMRKVHENYLDLIQTKMLRHPLIENVLIKKMTVMSDTLRKYWMIGMSQGKMLQMEDTLKKCWQVVNDFESIKYTTDFNQLSWHFGRPPSYLTT